jgi:streptogramin lyase
MAIEMKRKIFALAAILLAFAIAAVPLSQVRADGTTYQLVDNWAQFPDGGQWGVMSAVDIDSKGNIYALQRDDKKTNTKSQVLVFDSNGKFLKSWAVGMFPVAHGLRVLADGNVWVTDHGVQQVFKFDPDGNLLMTLGQKGVSGDNNSQDSFNGVSDIAMGKNGDLFVADGEGKNTRVVKFSKDGKFIKFWGTKGSDPGQFDTPHSIAVDARGNVWVCDRGNKRLQEFDEDGKFLSQLTQFGTTTAMAIGKNDVMYVADAAPENSLTVMTADGKVLATFGGLANAHGVAVDASGNIYVAESGAMKVLKYVKK